MSATPNTIALQRAFVGTDKMLGQSTSGVSFGGDVNSILALVVAAANGYRRQMVQRGDTVLDPTVTDPTTIFPTPIGGANPLRFTTAFVSAGIGGEILIEIPLKYTSGTFESSSYLLLAAYIIDNGDTEYELFSDAFINFGQSADDEVLQIRIFIAETSGTVDVLTRFRSNFDPKSDKKTGVVIGTATPFRIDVRYSFSDANSTAGDTLTVSSPTIDFIAAPEPLP